MEGAAIVGDFPERAKLARQAGCDMILVCNNPLAAEQVLDATPIEYIPLREQRLLAMLGQPELVQPPLKSSSKWQTISQQISKLAETYA